MVNNQQHEIRPLILSTQLQKEIVVSNWCYYNPYTIDFINLYIHLMRSISPYTLILSWHCTIFGLYCKHCITLYLKAPVTCFYHDIENYSIILRNLIWLMLSQNITFLITVFTHKIFASLCHTQSDQQSCNLTDEPSRYHS